ncbi:MAG: PfkB family carbohydrate kinase, partial [Candidatus Latescibacteria bacterium]|nr:PfkB family carbohydrate kinase [Candidatus Latescibacterota bacterium]
MPQVLVIGSSNTDLVVRIPRLPAPGETLLGGTFFTAAGGKGANQAVAAARAGAQVTFVARIGRDEFGTQALTGFKREGLNTNWIISDPDLASGVAFILVDSEGENSIVVASGANAALSPVQIDSAAPAFAQADICLLQLETPLETVAHAISTAVQHNAQVILNPAPATDLPAEIWPHLYLITPNETETEILTGINPIDEKSTKAAAMQLLEKGAQNAIITLGSQGAFVATPDQTS